MNTNNYYEYYKPIKLLFYTNKSIYLILCLIITFIIASFYIVIGIIGTDIQQQDNYLIIYIHVPSAWISMLIYILISITSLLYLINKNPLINIITQSGLIIGCLFTFITLITGILWGKPMWGTYWVWDARLTSVLILFIIYLINIFINKTSTENIKNSIISSTFILIGLINIPIIKLSVEWWNTLHQPSSISQMNASIHISIMIPILYMIIVFILITIVFLIINIRHKILLRKIHTY
jgi:heme exporter protein C